MKNLTVAFRNFANVPKKEPLLSTTNRNYGYQFMQNDSLTCDSQGRNHLLVLFGEEPATPGGCAYSVGWRRLRLHRKSHIGVAIQGTDSYTSARTKNYPRDKRVLRQSSLAVGTATTWSSGLHRGGMVRLTGHSGPPRGNSWYR